MELKSFELRRAVPADIPALSRLIELSVRTLQAADYSPAQIDGALGTVFGVDTQLIADGTYFVLDAVCDGAREVAGCGGWSRRKTLYGGDHGHGRQQGWLDPLRDNAKIRAFFVHPDWARKGVGSRILQACEEDAVEQGFQGFDLAATLTGERLYRARGYQVMERIEVALANGACLPVILMSKAAKQL